MPAPILIDLSHTSHTRARTGVQRVARSLRGALSQEAAAVCFDPYQDAWRPLEASEERTLAAADPSPGRGARWPLTARLRGRLRRLTGVGPALAPAAPDSGARTGGVLVPEIFSPAVAGALPRLFAASSGPRVALFHDAIALQYPEFTPRGSVARFPAYLRELLLFDGIAAVSEASRRALVDYWSWLGVARTPEVVTIPLGVDPYPLPAEAVPAGRPPTILCVGSIEGRKNHLALLDACESLWARGLTFRLRLVGLENTETGAAAIGRMGELTAKGRSVQYDGPVSEALLDAAYADCAFTVYPSLAEGFGLPVAESLSRGKACLCRMDGALGEIAKDGGCVGLGTATAPEIATAVEGLLASPDRVAALERAARGRRFRSWTAYAAELTGWMRTLRRHA